MKLIFILIIALILRLFVLYNQSQIPNFNWQQDRYADYAAGNISAADTRLLPGYPVLIKLISVVSGLDVLSSGLIINIVSSVIAVAFIYIITKNYLLSLIFALFPPLWLRLSTNISTEPLTVIFLLISFYLLLRKNYFFAGFISGLCFTVRLIAICFGLAGLITTKSKRFLLGFLLGASTLFIFNLYCFGWKNIFIQFITYPQIGGAGGTGIGFIQIVTDIFRALDWKQYTILISGLFYLLISTISLFRLFLLRKSGFFFRFSFYLVFLAHIFIFSVSPIPLLEEFSRFLIPVFPFIIIGIFLMSPQRVIKDLHTGLLKTFPPPKDSDGIDISDRDYQNMDERRWKYLAKNTLSYLEPRNYNLVPKLLDVGCGAGYFSNEAKIRGYDVTAIDISKKSTDYAAAKFKINTICTDLTKFKPMDKYDVILLNHVLEHITEIDKFVEKVKLLLKKDGVVLISAPNYDCLMRYLFDTRWYGFQPSQHVWQFTPKTLSQYLANRKFTINRIFPSSLDYNPPNSLKNIVFKTLTRFAEYIDRGDQLVLLATPA